MRSGARAQWRARGWRPLPRGRTGRPLLRRAASSRTPNTASGGALRRVTFPAMGWRDGGIYQIYPRSFRDSDGDGVGDLPGVLERLDHLEWLGVDGIWLNPTFPSPNVDWGFDVSDYRGVHPDLGTLDDLDELIEEAGRRGIRILLDLVP